MQHVEALVPMSRGFGAQFLPIRSGGHGKIASQLAWSHPFPTSPRDILRGKSRLTAACCRIQRLADERCRTAAGINILQVPEKSRKILVGRHLLSLPCSSPLFSLPFPVTRKETRQKRVPWQQGGHCYCTSSKKTASPLSWDLGIRHFRTACEQREEVMAVPPQTKVEWSAAFREVVHSDVQRGDCQGGWTSVTHPSRIVT